MADAFDARCGGVPGEGDGEGIAVGLAVVGDGIRALRAALGVRLLRVVEETRRVEDERPPGEGLALGVRQNGLERDRLPAEAGAVRGRDLRGDLRLGGILL